MALPSERLWEIAANYNSAARSIATGMGMTATLYWDHPSESIAMLVYNTGTAPPIAFDGLLRRDEDAVLLLDRIRAALEEAIVVGRALVRMTG